MLMHVNVKLEELASSGKTFNWQKPDCCPRCRNNLWGHGFTQRFFDGYKSCFYVKRYRCPSCGLTIILIPTGYEKKYQSSIRVILNTLKYRLINFTWTPWTTRQRAGHWLRKLIQKIKMDFMQLEEKLGLLKLLDWMVEKEIPFLV